MKTLVTLIVLSLFIVCLSTGCHKSHLSYSGPYSNMQQMAGRRYWTGIDEGATVDTGVTTPFYKLISKYVTIQINEQDSTISVQDTAMVFALFNLNATYTFQSIDTLGKLMVFYNMAPAFPTNYVIYYYGADSLHFFGVYNQAAGYETVNMSSN